MTTRRVFSVATLLLAALPSLQYCVAEQITDAFVTVLDPNTGKRVAVYDSRKPSLYTADFGDCMGNGNVNVTQFDAGYYQDNGTVLFHLAGNTGLQEEAVMMDISVFAYGEAHFQLTFNPCNANIRSLCPMRDNVSIEASGIIPVTPSDVANIPAIAFAIPDFEGEAILRLFSNRTQTQIGCFSAVLTNGATFSQPAAVAPALGAFTIVAIIASFATAVYGDDVLAMRKHHAHSTSVLAVFAVWQHIFFTGALSVNWPSVLVAFWSNYAWAAGMIYNKHMQTSIKDFIGSNKGNLSHVGAAAVGQNDSAIGGAFNLAKIYGRSIPDDNAPHLERMISKRALADNSFGFEWYGKPVQRGLPLPGNFSGFAGTLASHSIPVSNAFMTAFFWLLVLIGAIFFAIAGLKVSIELISRSNSTRGGQMSYFRQHWLAFAGLILLRTLYIAFFPMIFLCVFQFAYLGAPGVSSVAAIVFVITACGLFAAIGYACFYWSSPGYTTSKGHRSTLQRTSISKVIPWIRINQAGSTSAFSRLSSRMSSHKKGHSSSDPLPGQEMEISTSIHNDEGYTKRFGWLVSRVRQDRWWFCAAWLIYEFMRACFLAGASAHSLLQVFGLLAIEVIAFVALLILRPYESQRLNAMIVYSLGTSRVVTTALAATFDVRWNLARIPTTAIGVVIIVVQGLLTCEVLVLITVGAVSSYFSVMRNREDFRPRKWKNMKERYFAHLDGRKLEPVPEPVAQPSLPFVEVEQIAPARPCFRVSSVRRMHKIEDEGPESQQQSYSYGLLANTATSIRAPSTITDQAAPLRANSRTVSRRPSHTTSVHSGQSYHALPYGARPARASWNSEDFMEYYEMERAQETRNERREKRQTMRSDRAGHVDLDEEGEDEEPEEIRGRTKEREKLRMVDGLREGGGPQQGPGASKMGSREKAEVNVERWI